MSTKCSVIPHVQTEDGKVIESNLFNELLHYSNNDREFAKTYYQMATDPEFLQRFGEQLSFDENGEVTFKSLKNLTKFQVEKEQLLRTLNKDLGAGVYDYQTAVDKLQQFNRASEYNDEYLATIEVSDGKYKLSIVERNAANEDALRKVISDRSLQDRIIYQLREHGVNVEFLEKGNSRYSTENAERTADGLYSLIKLAKGENQTEELAEEAGHFAVAALGDNPLVDRLISNLTPEVQKQLLGEKYDSKYLGLDSRREVAGDLVGKALMGQIDQKSGFASLLNRIVNLVKKTFARMRGDDIALAKIRAQETAEEIARGFMSSEFDGSLEEALQTKETLYSAEAPAESKMFRQATNMIYDLKKQLGRIHSGLAVTMGKKLEDLERFASMSETLKQRDNSVFTSRASIEGLALLTDQLLDMFVEEIPSKLAEVDFSNSYNFSKSLRENGQTLRELHLFMEKAGQIVTLLQSGLQGSFGETSSLTSTGEMEITDPSSGQAIPLASISTLERKLNTLVKSYTTKVLQKEKQFFLRFLKEVYGDEYVRTTDMRVFQPGSVLSTTVKKGFTEETKEDFSLESYLNSLDSDISLFDAFIGAMSNSSDVISQIVDKAVKTYNRQADQYTNEVWDKLKVLRSKFQFLQDSKVLGKAGSETFYEINSRTGKLSGNFRTRHKWGEYEDDWNEFRMSMQRNFEVQHALEMRLNGKKITQSEYQNLSDEDKANVKVIKSDLDGMSLIKKDMEWDVFFRGKANRWRRAHSVWDKERQMYVPNESYDDKTYDEWASKGTTLYRDEKGQFYTEEQAQKLLEKNEQAYNNLTKETVTLGSLMDEFFQLKEVLDGQVDNSMPYYRAPQVKAYFGVEMKNRINQDYHGKAFKRARAFSKTLRRDIVDMFCEDSEDFDFGSATTYNTIDDDLFKDKMFFEKEKLRRLPLFYINKLRDSSELSTDIFHSMLAYSSMANSYWASAQIVHAAEIGGSILQKREMPTGSNPGVVANLMGKAVPDLNSTGGLAYRRYMKYIDKQIYGVGLKKLMITKKICLTKILGLLSKTASMVYLGGNVAGGIVNVGTGFNEMFKEACAGQFYKLSNFANAHKQYWASSASNWANLGNLAKEDKVSLMIRHFDILGDERSDQRNWYTQRDRFLGNFMLGESLMLPYSSGEHYMQSVTYLSLLDAIKLYDYNGNEIKAFDAYKVVDIGGGHKSLALLNGNSKIAASQYNTMNNLLNWTNELIKGNSGGIKAFIDKEYSQEELEVLSKAGITEPHHSNPKEMYNALQLALVESQVFFKDKDGKAKYEKLLKTMEKLDDLSMGRTDVNFTEEEIQMFKDNKVYYILEGGISDAEEFKDADFLWSKLEDAKVAVSNEMEKVTWSAADEAAFVDKAREVSDRLHGIYNRMDKTWAHQTIVGNMLLVMRGYALGMMQRRFGVAKYNTALKTDVEGSYRTLAKMISYSCTDRHFFKDTIAALTIGTYLKKDGKKELMEHMKQYGFNETQYYNMRRNCFDFIVIAALAILKSLTAKGDDDDDDKEGNEDPAVGVTYYLASRLYREQVAFNFPRAFVNEAQQLFKPTAPGVSILLDMCDIAEGMVGTAFHDYYPGMTTNDPGGKYYYHQTKKGLYTKGDKKWERKLVKMAPYYKSWLTYKHPYQAIESYDYGRRVAAR